jgi:hypothetical protein
LVDHRILYRKFVQSLGFSYINVDSCLYLWDQLFLKVKPLPNDMAFAFVALLMGCREELLVASTFSELAEMIYLKGKATNIDVYIAKYIQVAAGTEFYINRWNYEEIPIEAIKLDKVNLGPRIESSYPLDEDKKAQPGNPGTELPKADDLVIEKNMDRIMKENVIPEDEERFDAAEGQLVDTSLIKNLEKQATKKQPPGKGSQQGPLDDYKSTKGKGNQSKKSASNKASVNNDILSDLPKNSKKSKTGNSKEPSKQASKPLSGNLGSGSQVSDRAGPSVGGSKSKQSASKQQSQPASKKTPTPSIEKSKPSLGKQAPSASKSKDKSVSNPPPKPPLKKKK